MRHTIRVSAAVVLAGLWVTACATAPKATRTPVRPLPQKVEGIEGTHENTYRDGRVYIAGQPSEGALAELKERGVCVVVSVRTPREMTNREIVPFDEAAAAERLGMAYVNIPLGGEAHPYTPAAVDDLVAALDRTDGDVLVHCGMAGRAAYLWAAYLVRERGLDVNDALAVGRAIAIGPDPLEGLLGRPLERVDTGPR
jgi:protein tyrosine phosphatase (PTP) superfamily phosphohydrolase (DUF442 family)